MKGKLYRPFDMCMTAILTQQGSHTISHCVNCQTLFIYFNQLVLSFKPIQFEVFCDSVNDVSFEHCAVPFPNGEDKVVIRSPHEDIRFAFGIEEWFCLVNLVNEAKLMLQVQQLLGS